MTSLPHPTPSSPHIPIKNAGGARRRIASHVSSRFRRRRGHDSLGVTAPLRPRAGRGRAHFVRRLLFGSLQPRQDGVGHGVYLSPGIHGGERI